MPVNEDIHYRDAVDLARAIRERAVSAREVVEAHLRRIEQVNPAVNAIVSLDPEGALAAASRADDRLARGEPVGPLHGLPIAFKDTHQTRGMRTTHGSPLFADHVPDQDDLLVERIGQAGAIRIGKTNVPEFAAGSHTFNEVFGVTRNPYDLGRSAGGSSGGAAAALAAGMVPIADGSDMGGSLRNPASFCNVVGLRPTPGRVPGQPGDDLWDTLSTAGPMARSVRDVALLLSVMAGPDDRCPLSLETPGAVFRDLEFPADLRGVRIAWAPDLGGRVPVDPDVQAVLEPQLDTFQSLGASVELDCPPLDGAEEVFRTMRAFEFDRDLGPLLDAHPDKVKSAIAWNIAEGRKLSVADLARAGVLKSQLYGSAISFFDRYDLLLAPVSQVTPFPAEWEYPHSVAGQPQHSYLDWMRSAYLLTVLGVPALSLPGGFTPAGLPVGIQLVARPRAEAALLRIAGVFEAATSHAAHRPKLT